MWAFCGIGAVCVFLLVWELAFSCGGRVSDRFGRRRTLAASVLVYSVFTGRRRLPRIPGSSGGFRLLRNRIGCDGR